MTLIEIVVSIAIISTISLLLLSAIPLIRSQQQLRVAASQIQSSLRVAQQAAFNEARPPACLEGAGEDKEKQRRCSDIGIAIRAGEIIQFADTQADNTFSKSGDYVISRDKFPAAVTVPDKTWLFEASPPTITLTVDGITQAANKPASIVIKASSLTATVQVFAYGYTTIQF